MRHIVRKPMILASVSPGVVVAFAAVMLSVTPCSVLALEIPVTACGQEIPHNATAYLTADLDCTGTPAETFAAVLLGNKASLDLRGFTITARQDGVACLERSTTDPASYHTTKRCRVFGGGALVGGSGNGIGEARRIDVDNVTVTGFADTAAFNVTKLFLRGVQITGNAHVLWGVDKVSLEGSSVSGNEVGVSAKRVRLISSTVLGNAQFDLKASRKPVLRKSSQCGTSLGGPLPGGRWGVCANDF